jgi:hypothetical protein
VGNTVGEVSSLPGLSSLCQSPGNRIIEFLSKETAVTISTIFTQKLPCKGRPLQLSKRGAGRGSAGGLGGFLEKGWVTREPILAMADWYYV